MRKFTRKIPALTVLLLFASLAQAQVVQSGALNSPSIVVTPKASGDTFVVECNFNSFTVPTGAVSDSLKTVFTASVTPLAANGIVSMVATSVPLASAAKDTLTCPTGTGFGEIYYLELSGSNVLDGTAIQATGTSSPANATIPTNPGDIVIGFCITGTCTTQTGWTLASGYDDNLVAYIIPSATSQRGTFQTTGPWVLTLLALKHVAVTPPPKIINLGLDGSIGLADGTPIYVGTITAQQWNGTAWTSLGTATLDSQGTLSGVFAVNPAFVDSLGNIAFQICVPGIVDCVDQTFPLLEFQQGSTGIAINVALFPKVLLPKSFSVTLTP